MKSEPQNNEYRTPTFEVNGWRLPINEDLQKCLSAEEKDLGCVATELNLQFFLENKPPGRRER